MTQLARQHDGPRRCRTRRQGAAPPCNDPVAAVLAQLARSEDAAVRAWAARLLRRGEVAEGDGK